jgi:hypothetical protein
MNKLFSRRAFSWLPVLGLPLLKSHAATSDTFPMQPAELVRETVSVSHGNFKRVRELVESRPALAKAAVDWGFGDWESALGAASHTGNLEIAEFLIANGARPTLFSAAMMGHVEVVKAFIAAEPGAQRIAGPHGISLLSHAKKGSPMFAYLDSLGDAGQPATVPLNEADVKALPGTYVFGGGPNDRIEITANKGGSLMFLRKGTIARGMSHVGKREFHPAGAWAVRIRFSESGELTVKDGELELIAKREA